MQTPLRTLVSPSRAAALAAIAGAVFLPSLLSAQSAPVPNPASPAEGTPIELSPFEVKPAEDQGYNPTETLSGTRLRSNTKDTASALTILTPQLMDDLGIVNAEEALSFVANTEPYGITDDDAASFQGRNTTRPYRSRGLTTSSYSANFFDTIAPIDRYNTDSFSFMRGPNSILFGTGFAGGMLDAQPKRAQFRSKTAVDSRFDSLGSARVAAEVNREVIKDKLAVQVDVLRDDHYTYRKPAEEDRTSGYATATWRATEGTTVIVNGETGRINKVVPWPIMFWDYYTPWVNAGKKTLAAGQAAGAATGTRAISANNYYVAIMNPDGSSIPVMNWRNFAQGTFPTVGGAVRTNVPFADGSLSPIPLYTAIEGPGNRHDARYNTLQAIVEQRVTKDLYVEAGVNRMTTKYMDLTTIRANGLGIYVDPNQTLPNGQPNPYVGLPYIETNPFQFLQRSTGDETQGRLSAAYYLDLDNKKVFRDVGLGKYQFGAFLTATETNTYLQIEQESFNTTGYTGLANNAQNFLHRRFYLKPGGQTYLPGDLPAIVQAAQSAAIPAVNSGFLQTSQGSSKLKSRISGLSLVGQASWWNERIVYTAGWRRDRTVNTRAQMPIGANGIYLPFDDGTAPWTTVKYAGDTVSNGLALHLTRNLSLFGSRSGNFVPPSISRYDFNNNFLPPTEGKGSEVGARVDFLDGKIAGTLSYYDTTEANRADSLISKNKQVWIQYMWDAIKGPGYYTAPANPFTDTIDRKSSGYELQLTASPIPSLRIYGTVAKAEVVASNVDPIFRNYYDANHAAWAANRSLAVNDFRGFGYTTVGAVLDALDQEFAQDLAANGRSPVNTREWTGSLAVTYLLPGDRLKGLRATGRATWRSRPIIGYLLNSTPIRGRDEESYDLALGYDRKVTLWGHRVNVSASIQALNLLNNQDPVPFSAVSYGSNPGDYYVSNQQLPAPRLYQYTIGIDF